MKLKRSIICLIILFLMIVIAYCSLVDLKTANITYVNPIIKLTNGLINSHNWPFVQKAGHFVTWLILGMLTLTAFAHKKRMVYGLLFVFVAVLELCQYRVPGRWPLLMDVLISYAGLVSSFFVYKFCSDKKLCRKIMDGLKL